MKSASTRGKLSAKYGIMCFEIKAAGIMNVLPSVVICGICDYCDSHKSKQWHRYAAATAAAFAKLLLSRVRLDEGRSRRDSLLARSGLEGAESGHPEQRSLGHKKDVQAPVVKRQRVAR
jgi:hypothetical protein